MKRFYCTICKKIKRVRVMPNSVTEPYATRPEDRVGECRRHESRPERLAMYRKVAR